MIKLMLIKWLWLLLLVPIIIAFFLWKKIKDGKGIFLGGGLILVTLILVLTPSCYKKVSSKKFKPFNLTEILRDELIIQTIDFNKFIVFGTEEDFGSILEEKLFKYKDELKVYHVKGRAEVIFNEIDKLRVNEEDYDYENGICRFVYEQPDYKQAFNVRVYLEEMEVVQDFESEKFLGIDLKKPDQTQNEVIEKIQTNLEKEFHNQIVKGINKKNIANSDVYRNFILALQKMVEPYNYKQVQVAFYNNRGE